MAADAVIGKNVLDAACGEGYGSNLLAAKAGSVIGVDISQQSISHAAQRYPADNLSFQHADCRDLPFSDGQFDCIVSYETLEHMEDHESLIREFRRVLAPGGFLLISSPDKAVYTDKQKNENPFHVRELYRSEFEQLLGGEFPSTRLLGQKLAFHSMIWPLEGETTTEDNLRLVEHRETNGSVDRRKRPTGDAVYLIALCAAEAQFLPSLDGRIWLFDDVEESVYQHYHHEIQKNMQAGGVLQSKDAEIAELKAKLAASDSVQQRSWWHKLLGRT
jgi:SAM-dependent methyltransferase